MVAFFEGDTTERGPSQLNNMISKDAAVERNLRAALEGCELHFTEAKKASLARAYFRSSLSSLSLSLSGHDHQEHHRWLRGDRLTWTC